MTERNFGQTFSWWIAEVVNVKDPDESGRVQVRVMGRHDDDQNIPDKDLPWALPLQSVTSAAFRKIGTAPVGMVKGTKVVGFWADSDQQYPVIIGTFGKAGPLKEGTNTDGIPEIDFEKGSMPAPAQNADAEPYNPQTKLYKDRVTAKEIDNGVIAGYLQAKKDLETVKNSTNIFAVTAAQNRLDELIKEKEKKSPDIPKTTGVVGTEKSKELNKDPKKATTASVDRDSKSDIIEVVKEADPASKSATLPNMLNNYTTVRGIMNLTSPGGIAGMLGGALSQGLQQLAGQLGIGPVLGPIIGALNLQGSLAKLANGAMTGNLKGAMLSIAQSAAGSALGNLNLDPMIKSALYSASSTLLTQLTVNNGSIPKYTPPPAAVATNSTAKPPANLIVTSLTNYPLHIQQFYSITADPYPGYIEWKDKNGNKVYTARNGEPNYASAEQKIQAQQAAQLASQYSRMLTGGNNVTGNALKSMLAGAASNIAAAGISAVLGNGVNLNNILGFASKLLPAALSGAINGLIKGQLPQSFLNVGLVAKTLSQFTVNQALLAAKKNAMTEALTKSDDEKGSEVISSLEQTKKDLDTVKNSTNPFEVDMATRRLDAVTGGGSTGGGVSITRDGMGGGTLSVSASATQVGPGSTSVSRSGSATFSSGN